MKTLVFGGSFDPPHRAHAALLRAAAERIRPDRILVVPAHRSPFKSPAATPSEERAALAKLALIDTLPAKWRKLARLDLSEVKTKDAVFTVDTLARLEKADPKGELHFVCGQDAAAQFPRWNAPERLKKLATWWYGRRPGSTARPPAHFRRLPGVLPDVSSTELRASLALGLDCKDLAHESVLARIRSKGLYGAALLETLRRTLAPGRFEHTLNVAGLADSLARRWGADPDKARLAGLLHDAGRRFRPPELAAYVRRRRLDAPEREELLRRQPMLLHAYVSEDLARREHGVHDAEVLGAVRRHTLGDRRMGLLDTILYVADACSKDRTHPGAAATRRLAFADLTAAFRRCVADKLNDALRRDAWLHPMTVHLWNRLSERD